MYQPHAHHVLMFLGTFIALWSISLIARGLLHRPRIGPPPAVGPRKIKKPAVIAGLVGFPVGVGVLISGMWLRYWIFGREADPSGLTAFHAVAAGIVAFAAALAAWGLFADRAKRTLRCPKCWYDMASVASTSRYICPECGHDAKTTHNLQRTRRHWKLVTLAAFIACAGLLAPRFANISKGGIKSVLPTTALIAAFWQLPDSWVSNAIVDDEWTVEERLDDQRSWAWQRQWFASKLGREIQKPTTFETLRRAISRVESGTELDEQPFTAETYAFTARQLGSTDIQTRTQAAQLLRDGFVFRIWQDEGWTKGFLDAVTAAEPKIVADADKIAAALNDTDANVVLSACSVFFRAKARTDQVIDAILRIYPQLTTQRDRSHATTFLIGADRTVERALDAVVEFADEPSQGTTESVWLALTDYASSERLPTKLLERVDREIREGTDQRRLFLAARIRLTSFNTDESIRTSLLSLASTPGPQRAAILRACSTTLHPSASNSLMYLLEAAFDDPNPEVLRVAVDWAATLAFSREAGYRQFLSRIKPLVDHPDAQLSESAIRAIAWINQSIEAEREAGYFDESIHSDSPTR